MSKLVMKKTASENIYYHPDFHIATSMMIEYIEKKYGKKAVKNYLKQFAKAYYSPLKEKIRKNGLVALKRYIEKLYRKESGEIEIDYHPDQMQVKVKKCPAVSHIKKKGFKPAESFFETTKTVYETIVEGTGFDFEMKDYDKNTGKTNLIFRRKNDILH